MFVNHKCSKFFTIVVCLVMTAVAIFIGQVGLAADLNTGIEQARGTGLSDQDIRITIANIIRIALGFLGIIAVGLIIYAGWLWMSSEGNEEKVDKAKKFLKNAVIGLAIILSAFGITSFILAKLISSAGNDARRLQSQPLTGQLSGLTSLGNNIVSSHYPARDQKAVPRNTKIVITFRQPMDASTLILDTNNSGQLGDCAGEPLTTDTNSDGIYDQAGSDTFNDVGVDKTTDAGVNKIGAGDGSYTMVCDQLNSANLYLYITDNGFDNSVKVTAVKAAKTDDNQTFTFKPEQYLGSAVTNTYYTVALLPGIKKANGDAAFPQAAGGAAYDWSFEVSTVADTIPPKVKSIIPLPDATEPKNVVIQINFSEAVDPTSASGAVNGGFDNLQVKANGAEVAGSFYMANQLSTVEFLSDDACGTNSCGDKIRCLPGDQTINTLIKAAALAAAGEPTAVSPYNGLVDMADNSLDGNGDGQAQGPDFAAAYNANNPDAANQGDSYTWSFSTNNEINNTPPQITQIAPASKEQGVGLSAPVQATFGKILMNSSINSASAKLEADPPHSATNPLNFWPTADNDTANRKTKISINHSQYNENTNYYPELNSNLKDIYQNCYSPCSGLGVTGNPSCCDGIASDKSSCR